MKHEIANHGRAWAAVITGKDEDGNFYFGADFQYSHGGMGMPVGFTGDGFPSEDAAKMAGIEYLLRHLHKPFDSEPQSIHDELAALRQQIEQHLRQPSLF